MSNILNDIQTISYSDNFKVWIDRFNDIVTELKDIEFAIDGDYVNIESNQTINGIKTFSNISLFNSNVTIGGNLNLANGLIQTDNANKHIDFTYAVDGDVNFIGVNGINLLSNSTAPEFSLNFVSPSTTNIIVLDYADSDGIFKIANNVNLEVENATIKLGDSEWQFPEFPISQSILRYNSAEGGVIWQSTSDFIEDFSGDIVESIALTNATEIMPVGTIIEVDATTIISWANGGNGADDTNFYGWLVLNGQTIDIADDPRYAEIIALLNDETPEATDVQLATSASGDNIKLIKFLPDAVATFSLSKGDGILFFEADGITPKNSATLKNNVTRIALNTDSDVFQFSSGQLQLKTNIPRYTIDINGSRLTTSPPVNGTDAANKAYVDARVAAGGVEGSCFDLMSSSDNLGYSDAKNSFSIVDKRGAGRAWRTLASGTLTSTLIEADVTLNAISPFGINFGNVVPLTKTFATPDQFFFVDSNDVIYGYGTNSRGDIASSSRGVGEFSSYYNSGFYPSNPYNASVPVRQLLPAFLPIKAAWDANVILFDSATGISGSNDSYSNITIKTKDGYDNQYNTPDVPTSGLVNYFDSTNRPYTRGYYISTGLNTGGQLGRGNATDPSATTGPLVWGPNIDSPGRNLWYNFALTETEKQAIKTSGALTSLLNSSSTEIRKRFNWFKPNAILAGGLEEAATEEDAIAAWRFQTGLLSEAFTFSDYSWYIKKVVRTYDAHYVIVGKPGNESDNEVWCAGINRTGAFGNSRSTTTAQTDFAPMLSESTRNNDPGFFTRATTGGTTGTLFKRTDDSNHDLNDFDNLTFGSNIYYVIIGDANGANRATQFRLFSTFNGAQLAYIGGSQTTNIVSLSNSTTTGISAGNTYRGRCKAIVDIIVSRGTGSDTSGDGILLRKALTFSTIETGLLDRVPESTILTDQLFACGLNTNGRLGIGNLDNPTSLRTTAFPTGKTKIVKSVLCNFSAASFALSSSGVLYFSGNRASGCSDSGTIIGNTISWTPISKPNVRDFFVIDDSGLSRIFIICEPSPGIFELYAGGINTGYVLGSSVALNVATPSFVKVIFPENPKNIVNIAGVMQQTYILCKDPGEEVGRVYVAGTELTRSYFPVSTTLKTIPQFKNIDRDIL